MNNTFIPFLIEYSISSQNYTDIQILIPGYKLETGITRARADSRVTTTGFRFAIWIWNPRNRLLTK